MKKDRLKPLSFIIRSKFLLIALSLIFLGFFLKDNFYTYLALPFIALFLSDLILKKGQIISFSLPNIRKSSPKKKETLKKVLKKTNFKYIEFLSAFTISSIFFLFLGLSKIASSSKNIFINYFEGTWEILKNDYILLIIFLVVVVAQLIFIFKTNRKQRGRNAILFHSFLGLVLGYFASFLFLIIFSFLHLNTLSLKIKFFSSKISDPDTIASEIQKSDLPPKIINISGKNYSKALFQGSENAFSTFYSDKIVNLTPIILNFADKNGTGIFYFGNNLYFSKIDQQSIESIAPIVSKKYVQLSLDGKYVKDLPKISVIGRQEYLKYREQKINEQIDKIQEAYDAVSNYLQNLYANIANANTQIKNNESAIDSAISSRDYYYNYCMNAGYYSYYLNYFFRSFSDEKCESDKQEWNGIIAQNEQNITEWRSYINSVNSEIASYKELQENLGYYIELVESQKQIIVYELGLFEPDDQIKVVLDTTKSSSLADFFATSIHEYFHYTSYVSEEKVLPSFFEEALTEYFARKSVEEILNFSTNQGYPAYIDLIGKMTSDIGEDKMKDIYLTKNFDLLKSELNYKYGEHFYDDTQYYFDILPYLDLESQVNIVNDIMFRINGEKINVEDVVSSETEL